MRTMAVPLFGEEGFSLLHAKRILVRLPLAMGRNEAKRATLPSAMTVKTLE